MKNKMLCFLLTSAVLVQALSGVSLASEFTDGITESIEMISEDIPEDVADVMNENDIYVSMEEEISEKELPEDELPERELSEDELPEYELPEAELSEENLPEDVLTNDIYENHEAVWDDEFEMTVFSDGNYELLTASDEESAEFIETIASGEVLALTPVAASDFNSSEMISVASNDVALLAAIPDTNYTIYSGAPLFCDEVWSQENFQYPCVDNGASYTDSRYRQCTVYRTIQYTDAEGKTRTSLLYCLEASKTGINAGEEGEGVSENALSVLTNATMKKILYFGYGGPGDICNNYDPSCSHIDWSKNPNRFLFTHYALSKTYCGDLGYATEAEVEHVGLNKFISYIKTLSIPNRKAVKISVEDRDGNIATGTNLSIDLSLYRVQPNDPIRGLDSSFTDGYQITPLIQVTDEGETGNGLRIMSTESDKWQILYWNTEEEYLSERGPNRPRVLTKGKTVTLKSGSCFRIVFPEEMEEKKTFTYEMSLYPISFLVLDGDVQAGGNGFQNMGTYVYQDTRGTVKLTVNAAPMGNIQINKSSHYDGAVLKDANYQLIAAQDLYSGIEKIYKKGDSIATGKTDTKGNLVFENLIPGKYYLKETAAPSGYILDSAERQITVSTAKTTVYEAVNIPELQGTIMIEKFVEGTKLRLKDAQFTIYSWSETKQNYSGEIFQMSYDESQKKYLSPNLIYHADNGGKFKIVETKNPQGYSGDWSQEIRLVNRSGVQKFEFKVENSMSEKKIVEIQKICSETGKSLSGAQFTIYEYSKSEGTYKNTGNVLNYHNTSSKYISDVLEITDDNEGKYKIVETALPEDYTGFWQQEINILDIAQPLQFIVTNDPIVYPKGTVSISKTDCLTGKVLRDAEFTIYAWDSSSNTYLENPFDCMQMGYDSTLQKYVSGELEINPQNNGKYKIVETKNPEGYEGSWQQEILLTEGNAELHFDVTNDPIDLPLGTITVVKKIKENDITWGHGNPVFHFIVEGVDLQGKYHKYENYIRFVKGNYSVDSDGFAVLSYNFTKIPLGTYQIYERNVLRYFLKDAYANTANVTVIKENTPVYGADARGIAHGQAKLSIENEKASITFVNEKKRYDDYSHNSIVKNSMSALSVVNMR